MYSTAQIQHRTLASKLIASAWIIADWGGMAPIMFASINLIPCGMDTRKRNECHAPLIGDC